MTYLIYLMARVKVFDQAGANIRETRFHCKYDCMAGVYGKLTYNR